MRQLSFAVFCLLGAGGVSAQELDPSFEQFFAQSQQALQAMLAAPGEEGATFPVTVPGSETEFRSVQLTQTSLNAVNIVSSNADLNAVVQEFSGQQVIDNRIFSPGPGGDVLYSVDQSGANYANMLRGQTINLADQEMTGNALQIVSNTLAAGGSLADVVQSGINAANIAMADHAIGTADQVIDEGAVQQIINRIELDAGATVSGWIEQNGINFGNVMVAERVDDVTRLFAGDQIVENTVILNGSTVPRISQSGSNIANYFAASSIGTVRQLSIGEQRVTNTVLGPDGEHLSHPNIVQTELNYQGASNVVNLMVLRNSQSASQQPVLVEQTAEFEQSASGSSGQSQTGNAIVISR